MRAKNFSLCNNYVSCCWHNLSELLENQFIIKAQIGEKIKIGQGNYVPIRIQQNGDFFNVKDIKDGTVKTFLVSPLCCPALNDKCGIKNVKLMMGKLKYNLPYIPKSGINSEFVILKTID